jgi:hypothetical protein
MKQAMPSGGWGPWFCALFFDSNSQSSYLVNHTMPHLAQDALGDSWTMVMKVGPFSVWQACESYRLLWSMYTHKMQRIRRGVQLFCNYHTQYELSLWWTSNTICINEEDNKNKPLSGCTSELVQLYSHLHLNHMSVEHVLDAQDFIDPPKKRIKATGV